MVDPDAFANMWSLGTESRAALSALNPAVQAQVMEHFSPEATTTNIDATFISFLRNMQQSVETCLIWCNQVGLDQSCLDALMELNMAQREAVMSTFSPQPNIKNVGPLFISFCRGVKEAPAEETAPAAETTEVTLAQTSVPGRTAESPASKLAASLAAAKGRLTTAATQASEEDLARFQQHWQLDSSCIDSLRGQPPEVQQKVLLEFQPRPGTRNVNSLFLGFVRSVASGGQQHARSLALPAPGNIAPLVKEDLSSEIVNFALRWELDEECVGELMSVPPEVATRVITSFAPRDTTRNVKYLFLSFLKSIATGGVGRGPPSYGSAPQGAWAGGNGGFPMRSAGFGGQAGMYPMANGGKGVKGGLGMGMKGGYGGKGMVVQSAPSFPAAQPAAPAYSPADVRLFGMHWGLDEDCVIALLSQPSEVQREVLDSFAPKPGTQNVNSLFMGFLKSRVGGPNSMKRQRVM